MVLSGGSSGGQIGSAALRLWADTKSLNKGIDGAERNIRSRVRTIGKVLTGIGVTAVAGFGLAAVKSFADAGDEVQKMAQRTGISTEALSELRFAAEQSGTSLATVEKGSKRMAAMLFDAELGLSTSVDALEALSLNLDDLKGKKPEEQFQMFANALAGVEDESKRAALAQRVFGRVGTQLLPLFTQGEKGMAALREQARELGVVFDQDAANAAADFKDAQNELMSALRGVFITIGKQVVPALTTMVRWFVDRRDIIQNWAKAGLDAFKAFFAVFQRGWEVVFPLVRGVFNFVIRNKPILIAAVVAIGAAIAMALGPVSLAVVAITGIITLIGYLRDNWRDVLNAIVGYLQTGLSWIVERMGQFARVFIEVYTFPLRKAIEITTRTIEKLTGLIGDFVSLFNEEWGESIKAFTSDVADTVVDTVDNAKNALQDVVGGAIDDFIGGPLLRLIDGMDRWKVATKETTDDISHSLFETEGAFENAASGMVGAAGEVEEAMDDAKESVLSFQQALGGLNMHQAGQIGAGIGGAYKLGFGNVSGAQLHMNIANMNAAIRRAVAAATPQSQGGIHRTPTLALLSERGQEEAVIPLEKLPEMVGKLAGGGNSYFVENLYGVEDFAAFVAEAEHLNLRKGYAGSNRR